MKLNLSKKILFTGILLVVTIFSVSAENNRLAEESNIINNIKNSFIKNDKVLKQDGFFEIYKKSLYFFSYEKKKLYRIIDDYTINSFQKLGKNKFILSFGSKLIQPDFVYDVIASKVILYDMATQKITTLLSADLSNLSEDRFTDSYIEYLKYGFNDITLNGSKDGFYYGQNDLYYYDFSTRKSKKIYKSSSSISLINIFSDFVIVSGPGSLEGCWYAVLKKTNSGFVRIDKHNYFIYAGGLMPEAGLNDFIVEVKIDDDMENSEIILFDYKNNKLESLINIDGSVISAKVKNDYLEIVFINNNILNIYELFSDKTFKKYKEIDISKISSNFIITNYILNYNLIIGYTDYMSNFWGTSTFQMLFVYDVEKEKLKKFKF